MMKLNKELKDRGLTALSIGTRNDKLIAYDSLEMRYAIVYHNAGTITNTRFYLSLDKAKQIYELR